MALGTAEFKGHCPLVDCGRSFVHVIMFIELSRLDKNKIHKKGAEIGPDERGMRAANRGRSCGKGVCWLQQLATKVRECPCTYRRR